MAVHILFGGNPPAAPHSFSNSFPIAPQASEENVILWRPVAVPQISKEKETAMVKAHEHYRRLRNDLLRLALGIVFFAHGAAKSPGPGSADRFRATLGLFTQQVHIPPC